MSASSLVGSTPIETQGDCHGKRMPFNKDLDSGVVGLAELPPGRATANPAIGEGVIDIPGVKAIGQATFQILSTVTARGV
ncbi:MAG: hypothetical protein SFZ03_08380 [Candidatus Melainabacteria bacterium]|nr:hypothetical protein [Candidatus Melainabacteria bacterium]